MPIPRRPALLALALVAPLAGASCSRPGGAPAGAQAPATPPAGATVSGVGVVAEVNGAPILMSELDQKASSRLARLRQEEYEIRRQALDELVGEKLVEAEARKRGISTDELLKREVADKSEALSPAAVLSIYEQNKQRFGTAPKEQALARIREVLGQRAQAERRAAFENELRAGAKVAVRLDPPRVKVSVPEGAPATGPAAAPVSIIEFTDYQCPYCHRAQGTIDEVLQRYAGKVRFVHMDFPLDGHAGALPAARAARCAGEQGKFWELHHDLMTVQGPFDDADLKSRAAKLGLEAAAFGSCLASDRHDATIRASFEQGEALGVTGTPAYFVNGRMLSGARPIGDFVQVIDGELAGR